MNMREKRNEIMYFERYVERNEINVFFHKSKISLLYIFFFEKNCS